MVHKARCVGKDSINGEENQCGEIPQDYVARPSNGGRREKGLPSSSAATSILIAAVALEAIPSMEGPFVPSNNLQDVNVESPGSQVYILGRDRNENEPKYADQRSPQSHL